MSTTTTAVSETVSGTPSGITPRPAPGARSEARRAACRARRRELESLGDRIARQSALITAATYELLVMIRRFDEEKGWHEEGAKSCAAWLAWRTGVTPGTARERVRVARALGELPELSDAVRRGELSYSVARALTRVASPENEAELVAVALHATAAQMERLVSAWKRADRGEAELVAEERERHARRELFLVVDHGDGSWVAEARLDPEVGAAWKKALEAAEDALYRGGATDEEAGPAARRADAMGLVVEAALGDGLAAVTGREERTDEVEEEDDPDGQYELQAGASSPTPAPVVGRAERYQVVVRVSAETLSGEGRRSSGPEGAEVGLLSAAEAVPRIEGGPCLCPETARRLACDASVVGILQAGDGSTLDVGRKRRTVPPATRRALEDRDGGCRFPGCGSRFCDAHHVTPWAEGGETNLDNLLLLCRHHHRRVHEDGWGVEVEVEGGHTTVRFHRPDGSLLPRAPEAPELGEDPVGKLERSHEGLGIDARTATPDWDGVRMDVDLVLGALSGPSLPGIRYHLTDVSAETPPGSDEEEGHSRDEDGAEPTAGPEVAESEP